jgi:spoIIIJ-associated protein
MIREFEAKTEQEAIDIAVSELNLDREEFDVEIVDNGKKGIFRKGAVKIKVHVTEEMEDEPLEPEGDLEEKCMEFLSTVLEKMGYPGTVSVQSREDGKVVLGIDSPHSGIIIGKKGKNLDAIQLLVNVYVGKNRGDVKVLVDTENYRARREESLRRLARKTADQVRKSRGSRLLDPMNPFERRLIHTTLNEMEDINTISEGEGLYKQVRVIYREM